MLAIFLQVVDLCHRYLPSWGWALTYDQIRQPGAQRPAFCVTVTGPPAAICALNLGTTDPFDTSILPKRTEISRILGMPTASCARS